MPGKALTSDQWTRLISWLRANGEGRTAKQLGADLREAGLAELWSVPERAIIEALRHAGFSRTAYSAATA